MRIKFLNNTLIRKISDIKNYFPSPFINDFLNEYRRIGIAITRRSGRLGW
ncbi:hypothetical protein ES332_D04G078500v1 [Gossypium tomentosum]|uniref:Uncharacterized protein n=1 Tax=Gossypium tomentosum TaxID=34277 RepID=A0A5D2LBH6_GOSTO|nr:hypothetical protein ES332_D04G078500v1 [Gossypium tomentosum]